MSYRKCGKAHGRLETAVETILQGSFLARAVDKANSVSHHMCFVSCLGVALSKKKVSKKSWA